MVEYHNKARVEYEQGEKQKVCYGEIDKEKIKNITTGGEDFIYMENDGIITWLDKESLISVESLDIKTVILLKLRMTDYLGANTKTDENAEICS